MMNAGRRMAAGLALALLLAALAAPSLASVFLKEDVASLAGKSRAVVHARVADMRSYWNAERTMIFTDVTLEVKGRLRGTAEGQLVVRVPGGTVDDYTVEMEGAPEFVTGEQVVAFIGSWDDGVPMVAGYFQGLSRVEHDKSGNAILHGGVADGLPMIELARQVGRSDR